MQLKGRESLIQKINKLAKVRSYEFCTLNTASTFSIVYGVRPGEEGFRLSPFDTASLLVQVRTNMDDVPLALSATRSWPLPHVWPPPSEEVYVLFSVRTTPFDSNVRKDMCCVIAIA